MSEYKMFDPAAPNWFFELAYREDGSPCLLFTPRKPQWDDHLEQWQKEDREQRREWEEMRKNGSKNQAGNGGMPDLESGRNGENDDSQAAPRQNFWGNLVEEGGRGDGDGQIPWGFYGPRDKSPK